MSADDIVPLIEASDVSIFGSKAVGLGDAIRDGLPVPPGVALAGPVVEAVAGEDAATIERVLSAIRDLRTPLAVRSSAVDEDGADASFAGQHLTLLNVPTIEDVPSAVRQIWWSANSDSAITYRQRVGLFTRPSVGVVVQSLLASDTAGVMFTKNPVNEADERVVEAAWGLGEAVVAGRVIPDSFRIAPSGEVLECTPGFKKIAIRSARASQFRVSAGAARPYPTVFRLAELAAEHRTRRRDQQGDAETDQPEAPLRHAERVERPRRQLKEHRAVEPGVIGRVLGMEQARGNAHAV